MNEYCEHVEVGATLHLVLFVVLWRITMFLISVYMLKNIDLMLNIYIGILK
jgi:hypothetical protein